MLQVSYLAIIVAALVQFFLGALWYSPIMFGKLWAEIMEMTHMSKADLEKMQKEMMPAYLAQFFTGLLFIFILANFIAVAKLANIGAHAFGVAGWVWLGFVLPIQIGGVIWSQTKKKFWLKQIFVASGYQLVSMMIAAGILSVL